MKNSANSTSPYDISLTHYTMGTQNAQHVMIWLGLAGVSGEWFFDSIEEANLFIAGKNNDRWEMALANIKEGNTLPDLAGDWQYRGFHGEYSPEDSLAIYQNSTDISDQLEELVMSQTEVAEQNGYHRCQSCGDWKEKEEFYGENNESREGGEWICDDCFAE